MSELTILQAKQVYRAAIDPSARDDEGANWWESVTRSVREVCASPTVKAAAASIAWWHHDWASISDTPIAAAKRIRAAAKAV